MPLAIGRSTPDSFQQRSVPRGGAGKAQADFDILRENGDPWDLIDDGDFSIPTDVDLLVPPDIGGNAELALGVQSDDNATFSVTVQWVDEDGNVLYEQTPAALQDTTDAYADFKVKGDRFAINVTDTSGDPQNEITGTVNVH